MGIWIILSGYAYLMDVHVCLLTAIRDRDQAVERHIHDCLALLPVLEKYARSAGGRPLTLIDVGSGGGFPGVVLAIARPQWQVCVWAMLTFTSLIYVQGPD